ncbi:MAG TPA: VWA domain-containing protein [Blastocatellia bacterium]|nr:VWA domain-containing protein [Blastocatellia bacterium]
MFPTSRLNRIGTLAASSFLTLLIPAGIAAQQQPAAPKPESRPEQTGAQRQPEGVVRITTQLVQIDAVVTDKKGDHRDDLTEDDFELVVDGKRQSLTYFKMIKLPEPKPPAAPPAANAKGAGPTSTMPTRMVAPEDVKRTIAFVIDDLGLSFQSTAAARRALKKFVDEQMQEGDLVGIIRTGRGLGALEQFTSDKRILYTAIERLTWNPFSRDMSANFNAPVTGDDRTMTAEERAREAAEDAENFRETIISGGTLSGINFVVRSLRALPGRKVAVLISDGFRLFGRERDNTLVLERVRRLIDVANRSSVVVYALDGKGLQTLFPTAADNTGALTGPQFAEALARASRANFDSQDGLNFLARETGGFAVFNNNDLNFGIQKALHDTQSYYLVGFDPEDEKFDRKYHSIKLKVKKPGLQVRTRAGFLGVPDPPGKLAAELPVGGQAARDRQILAALFSPFGARDLSLQMTSFFFNDQAAGSFVRSLFYIEPSQLTFKEDPERKGLKTLKMELVAFTFNESGQIVDQHGRAFTLSFDEPRYQTAMRQGIYYTNNFEVKRPGAYQFRAVLRDPETGRLGSAGQFIQVPDLTKNRLSLSGLILAAPDLPAADPKAAPAPAQPPADETQPSPAVRRFSPRGTIAYGAAVYNSTIDPPTGKPRLTQQVEVYHEGQVIYTGPIREVNIPEDTKLIDCQGIIKLTDFPTGDYMMHLIVTDTLAKQKYARTDQWMDFSVR